MIDRESSVELLTGKDRERKKSRIPAKLDLFQSVSGLILALFIVFHLLFESSILFGKEAMYTLTKMFEGEPLIKPGEPLIISALALVIFAVFIFHAFLAMRKFPASYREYKRFHAHRKLLGHSDTNLWFVQVVTGFMMFFLGSVHLYIMMTQPGNIGPYASSDRMYSDWMWPMYLLLLAAVILHTGVGLYRLIIKWGLFDGKNPRANRKRSKRIIQLLVVLYILLGVASLARYMTIGYEHQNQYGSRYIPESKQ